MNYLRWMEMDKKGISIEALWLLSLLSTVQSLDVTASPKIAALYGLLMRKELITEAGDFTIKGTEILKYLEGKEIKVPELNKKINSSKFEEWWKTYPTSDAFVLNGMTFPGVQSKKKDKPKCEQHFNKWVNEGISPDDIIKATAYHIEQAKQLSIKRRESQLTYISGSEIYLRNKVFEPYLELSKNVIKEETYKSNIL